MGTVRQVQKAGALYLQAAGHVVIGPGSGNIGVHAGAAVVFPHFIYHQHIRLSYQDAGHIGSSNLKKFRFPVKDLIRGNGFNQSRFIVGIFHAGDGKKDL